jgi:hypothetical protein
MKLPIMQFSPASYYFIQIWFKYSSQHPVLKGTQYVFFAWCEKPGFMLILNHRKNYSFVYFNLLCFWTTGEKTNSDLICSKHYPNVSCS